MAVLNVLVDRGPADLWDVLASGTEGAGGRVDGGVGRENLIQPDDPEDAGDVGVHAPVAPPGTADGARVGTAGRQEGAMRCDEWC